MTAQGFAPDAAAAEQQFIARVLEAIPRPMPDAFVSQIAMDLRSHIAERLEHGQSLDAVLDQFGDPEALAASYLAAVPLRSASFWDRAIARIIDTVLVVGILCAIVLIAVRVLHHHTLAVFLVPIVLLLGLGYMVVAEYVYGQTLGKRLLGVHVVREAGTRISLGQAVVRQIPSMLQFFWVDVLFALFTEKSQRAFELLSKTRVVCVPDGTS